MIETVLLRDLPDTFTGTYDAQGVHNIVENHFYLNGPESTRWVMNTEFQFSGLMKIASKFMGSVFRKQSMEFMNNFKEFAEGS